MIIATVIGTVVAPIQHPFFNGKKLLLVRGERPDGASSGSTLLAVDRVGAGVGERVLVMKEGSSARDLFEDPDAPVRTMIVGIIDEIEIHGQTTFLQGNQS